MRKERHSYFPTILAVFTAFLSLNTLFSTDLKAEDYFSGGYAGAYQRMPQDARGAALGHSSAALTDDISAVTENPALASTLVSKQFASNVQFLSLDRSMHSLIYGFPVKPTAGLVFTWQHAGVDNIQGRDFSNNPTEIYSSSQDAFYVSFANHFNPYISVGLSTKILMDRLPETSATGLGLEAGLLLRPLLNLDLAFVFRDMKSDITWDTQDLYEFGGRRVDTLPQRFIFSAVYRPTEQLLLTLSFKGSRQLYPTLHAGAEFTVHPLLRIRGGFDDGMPAFGLSTDYTVYGNVKSRMDYAFLYGRAMEGSGHLFSLSFYF